MNTITYTDVIFWFSFRQKQKVYTWYVCIVFYVDIVLIVFGKKKKTVYNSAPCGHDTHATLNNSLVFNRSCVSAICRKYRMACIMVILAFYIFVAGTTGGPPRPLRTVRARPSITNTSCVCLADLWNRCVYRLLVYGRKVKPAAAEHGILGRMVHVQVLDGVSGAHPWCSHEKRHAQPVVHLWTHKQWWYATTVTVCFSNAFKEQELYPDTR